MFWVDRALCINLTETVDVSRDKSSGAKDDTKVEKDTDVNGITSDIRSTLSESKWME